MQLVALLALSDDDGDEAGRAQLEAAQSRPCELIERQRP